MGAMCRSIGRGPTGSVVLTLFSHTLSSLVVVGVLERWRGSLEVGGNADDRNPVYHNMLHLLSLAGHANCGQAHHEEPVVVLHP